MKSEFDKIAKTYWYECNFDKGGSHLDHQIAMNNFKDGFKAALEWVLNNTKTVKVNSGLDIVKYIPYTVIDISLIEEELERLKDEN